MTSIIGEEHDNSHKNNKNVESVSLLDLLISSVQPSDEPDPLDGLENIGDTVIGQLAGTFGFGQDIIQGAQNMFEEANGYPRASRNVQKRRNNRYDVQRSDPVLPSSTTTTFPEPRAKKKCHQGVEEGLITADEYLVHHQVGNERYQPIDEKMDKDIERLLQTVNRVYGPKDWSDEEKTEFSKYCKILRDGKFDENQKNNLHNFYAKAYYKQYKKDLGSNGPASEEVVKEILGSKSAVYYPVSSGLLLNDPKKESAEELKEEDQRSVETKSKEPSPSAIEISSSYDPAAFSIVDPALKYEKEKEFRRTINNMFLSVFQNSSHTPDSQNRTQSYVGEVKELIGKLNGFMKENRKWNKEDAQQLVKVYNRFKEKFHLTIVQSKEFGYFIRRIYGKLEKHELDRENNTDLQDKRKYWQEYAKAQPPNKGQAAAGRPFIKTSILFQEDAITDDKKQRKAAYLRQWRLAQKSKQTNASGYQKSI